MPSDLRGGARSLRWSSRRSLHGQAQSSSACLSELLFQRSKERGDRCCAGFGRLSLLVPNIDNDRSNPARREILGGSCWTRTNDQGIMSPTPRKIENIPQPTNTKESMNLAQTIVAESCDLMQ